MKLFKDGGWLLQRLFFRHSQGHGVHLPKVKALLTNAISHVRICIIIGASLSEPYTSESAGTSVAFTKIYIKIWLNGTSVARSQEFTFKNRVKNQITYKCFRYMHSSHKELPE